jgi:lysophospholipase L1-like esterase
VNTSVTFAVIGDSAASGVGDSDENGNYFGWGYHLTQAFLEPVAYINASRPGAQSKEVLEEQLPKVLIHNPELVAVIVGGNDLLRNGFSPEAFENNLFLILQQIEAIGATALLLELHDPTELIAMPKLLSQVCKRRVDAVNAATRRVAARFGSVILETRSLPGIYDRQKWHVDRMHPSRNGHQFIADVFGHLLRNRGYDIGAVDFTHNNNRSRRDSILWMLRNGAPWFFKRSFDLLPALILLMGREFICSFFQQNRAIPDTSQGRLTPCIQPIPELLELPSLKVAATLLSGPTPQMPSNSASSMKSMAS